jgi:hypothetical protein
VPRYDFQPVGSVPATAVTSRSTVVVESLGVIDCSSKVLVPVVELQEPRMYA